MYVAIMNAFFHTFGCTYIYSIAHTQNMQLDLYCCRETYPIIHVLLLWGWLLYVLFVLGVFVCIAYVVLTCNVMLTCCKCDRACRHSSFGSIVVFVL